MSSVPPRIGFFCLDNVLLVRYNRVKNGEVLAQLEIIRAHAIDD